jgi:hypothetical protein
MIKSYVLFLIFILANNSFAIDFCEHFELPSSYKNLKVNYDKNLILFSQKKVIANKSDDVLTKLIKANSPVLKGWVDQSKFKNVSDDQIVKDWRLYYAKNFVLAKYPSGDQSVDREIELFVDEMLTKNISKNFKLNLEKLFSIAKKKSIETIEKFNISQKDVVIKRINEIKLFIPKKLKTSKNNSVPLELIDWGIAYDPIKNEVNIGLNSLIYSNDESLIAAFVHEIGHSFDSCRWGAFFDGKWPFAKVEECLRSEKSVFAKKRDDSLLKKYETENKISSELLRFLKENPTCNKTYYPPQGVQADQILESFADWFSAEVVSSLVGVNYNKVRLDLCEKNELSVGSSYPTNRNRLEKIYLVHPKFNVLKDSYKKENLIYCKFE